VITTDVLVVLFPGLQRPDLERWISNQWVRPDQQDGDYAFREIDVARVRLIRELRDEMQVNEDALPVVLSLLDQLYDQRRRMRDLNAALMGALPESMRRDVAVWLAGNSSPGRQPPE
jgi:chaperone modulatory protein CbpM